MMKLLSATPSPYARKVRIALAEKGLPFELVTEVPWNGDTTTPKYNPLEKVPVLILEDGTTVYESRHILEYLEVKYPDPPMFPTAPDAFLAAKRLEVLADGICDAAVLVIFERRRPRDARSVPWEARQRRKIEGGFAEVARLVPSDGYCVGGAFGLGDIAVGSLLDYISLRLPEIDWSAKYANLVGLRKRLSQRPSFRDTEPRVQQIDTGVV
ncbi:MAG: glutathione S-transferase N-terminal domain-containing protein [Thiotrichales bacterium]|nr:glutathione S-transferase N-terminal domain-containing protein [Thiotrichales bacterium]